MDVVPEMVESEFDRALLLRRLRHIVPDIDSRCSESVPYMDLENPSAPDLHVLFGLVVLEQMVIPVLDDLGSGVTVHEELVNRVRQIFSLFEEMADSPDSAIRNIVSVTVSEVLGDVPQRLATVRSFMGPATRLISDDVEGRLGRDMH
jgi:hypothetical protein